jgi:hypothetical protein
MKNISLSLFYLLLLTQVLLEAKILIITHAFNRPDFLPLQKKTFDAFLAEKDDYEFVVFNDARDPKHRKNIRKTCQELDLKCVEIPQEIHDRPYLSRRPGDDYNASSVRVANVVQYSLDVLGFLNDDIVAIVDSDLFLIKNFSIREFMKGYVIAGLDQDRQHVHYLWNGFMFFDMPRVPDREKLDFNCGKVDNIAVDTGGNTYYYLKSHKMLPVRYVNEYYPHILSKEPVESLAHFGITNKTMKFITIGFDRSALLHDSTFFHYQSAGWDNKGKDYHQKKTAQLIECIEQALS